MGSRIRLVTQQNTYLSISGFEAWTGSGVSRGPGAAMFGNMQKGFCVTSRGRDQNGGVKKLNSLDINSVAR
jgi:hypothetical protein